MGKRQITLRFFIDAINKLLLFLKKDQRIKIDSDLVKVNVGSGLKVEDGWINIDASINSLISKFPKQVLGLFYCISGYRQRYSKQKYIDILKSHFFIHHEVKYGLPFQNETIDFIYSSHFLEHLVNEEAVFFIKEAYRTLKKEGIIRISVPDLEHAFHLYQKGDKEKALALIFSPDIYQCYHFVRHRYMYDYELLKKLLESAGFINIGRCSYKQGKVPDIDRLDNRPHQSLFVEANK